MALDPDLGKIVPLRPQRDDPPSESRVNGDIQNELDRIEKIRNDAREITRQIRLAAAAQLVAAARELLDGEPFYMDDCSFLDELQIQLQSDSV